MLDKTGTVTEGKPVVGDWIQAAQAADTEDIFYSLEKLSEHPLAEAVVRHFRNARTVKIDNFESITGRGVQGEWNGKPIMPVTVNCWKNTGLTSVNHCVRALPA